MVLIPNLRVGVQNFNISGFFTWYNKQARSGPTRQGEGVHTKIRDPGSGGGPDFLEKNLNFQIGIDTKFEGGCPKF